MHPGESNSSHIMNGLIAFLLGPDEAAVVLRRHCIFKIVPMLNPDGCINGSHRSSLAGTDLNRQWKNPSRVLSPTIFWTKLLYRFLLKLNRTPLLACDFHGHSRKKNVFLFGCENSGESEGVERVFSTLLAQNSSLFDIGSCRFGMEKSKEHTARVVLRKEMGIVNSFTLESTYCGMDGGEKRGMQVQIADLEKVGADFCRSVNLLLGHPALPRMLGHVSASPPVTPKGVRKSKTRRPLKSATTRKVKKDSSASDTSSDEN